VKRLVIMMSIVAWGVLQAAELYQCPEAPVIDGIEDPCWSQAEAFPLVDWKDGSPLHMKTVARIMRDNQSLYVFMHCREVNLVEARDQEKFNRHDAPIWNSNCVEFFFDVRNDGRAFYQFVVDIHNDAADLLHDDPESPSNAIDWNGFWRHAVGTYADGWTVEIAIPWSTLKMLTGQPVRLGMNISRPRRVAPFERGSLAPGEGGLCDFSQFLVFDNFSLEESELTADVLSSKVFLGSNRMTLRMRNHTAHNLVGQLELTGTASDHREVLRMAVPLEMKANEERDVSVDYRIDESGQVMLTAGFIHDKERCFLAQADYIFRQPLEFNDPHLLVFAGEDHPVYVRIFSDAPSWTVDVEILDHLGERCAKTDTLSPPANAFLVLPTRQLAPGAYTVRILLKHGNNLSKNTMPLKVIPRP